MKKLLTVSIGILLMSNLFAQTPYKVDKTLELVGGELTEVENYLTNITPRLSATGKFVKIVIENRDLKVIERLKKLTVV